MQIVLDFVTGKVGSDEFKAAWYSDPGIGKWLDELVDLRSMPEDELRKPPYGGYRMAILKQSKGSILEYIDYCENKHKINQNKYPKWTEIGWHFNSIAAIVVMAYPDIIPTSYYEDERKHYIETVGDYIGGPEVENLIGTILDQYPKSMGKTKRKKEAKAAIREGFHLEGNRYPRWIQEPEWPMGVNSPMAFLCQKRDGDLVKFEFRDVDTGETRIVEQFY